MRKRILAVVLTLTLLSASLSPGAEAAGGDEVRFQDANLYAAVAEQLTVSFTGDPDTLILSFPAGEREQVTELVLNNREIADLTGLGAFTGLISLNISNNSVEDLSELSGLTGLQTLSAYGCLVSDVTPLAGLTGLRSLSLAKNDLTDSGPETCVTSGLRTLTGLEELDLSHNMLRYTDGLEELRNLRTLDLYDNAVRDLSGLAGLDALEDLRLGENNEANQSTIAHLEALDTLTALRSLNFDKNGTPEVMDHIGGLTRMETLSLVENKISDLSPLSGMENLRELILFGNQVQSVDPVLGLSQLEELNLDNNGGALQTLNGIFTEDGQLVWPRLRKLGIAGCYHWNLRVQPETGMLFAMAEAGELELGFRYDRIYEKDWSYLPHTDPDGTTWVSYDDFLARGEEGYDDFNAIRNAHTFANECGCDEVRATEGKTYHIYNPYEYAVTANTNIDWHNATFVLHDEDIEEKYGRYWPLILVVNTEKNDIVTIENPDWTISRETKQIPQLADTLAPLNEKGYTRYLCIVQDEQTRQYIRFGSNANSGDAQQDRFLIDGAGNLENDVAWDFERITSFEIIPIPAERGYVRNATFISNAPESASETPYSRGGGKQIYFQRNIQWRKSANMEVSNIHHIVTSDDLCGSYDGLLLFTNCADMDVHDLTLFARKYKNSGRSTYDLVPNSSVNLHFSNMKSNDILNSRRWGVIGSSYLKDAVYENCELNRIDSHQGVYNLTVQDCTVGYHALTLTGQGTLNILRTKIISDAFMTLRYDYGSTWNGDVYILDSTLQYRGQWAEKIFNYQFSFDPDGSPHAYGYECHIPNIYIDNLTVDNRENTERTSLGVVFNWDTGTLDKIPASYWPRVMQVNSVQFINNDNLSATPRVQLIDHPANGLDGNYTVTDVRFHLDSPEGADVTRELWSETPYRTAHAVTVTAAEQPSTENRLTLTRDGTAVYEDRLLEGTLEETWTEPGLYRLTVQSADTRKGAAGESVWVVRILGTEPVVQPTLYAADGETVLTAIPGGPFTVRAEVLCADPVPEGSQMALAVYGADGAMEEIHWEPLDAGETVAEFAVENADGAAASGKLFLLGPELAPLSSTAQIVPES